MTTEIVERALKLRPDELYAEFQKLRAERKMRHRDAANELGVSEGEAVAAAIGQKGAMRAVRLTGPWPAMFEQVPSLGTVMALTRNDSTVHEKIGRYDTMSHEGGMGMALGTAIDLRIFYLRWSRCYAVTEDTPKGEQRSLQIYDAYGTAVHKVFLRGESDLMEWFGFVERHTHENQEPGETFEQTRSVAAVVPDESIDVPAFHAGWAAMKDTHEFFPLLRRFKLTRTQALRLAPKEHARRTDDGAARKVLQDAARDGVPIMCFVGNPGMIQIHSGPVTRVEVMGHWLNVLDSSFNLHLREDRIASTWVVTKPTVDGVVTSVELFDAEGETMAMFFGERKPGKSELESWRSLVARLPRLDA